MPQTQTEPKLAINRTQALTWLRQMLLIRRFEERSAMLYQNQKIGGFCHLYSGQEPVAVGSIGALREDDYVITAYRDHGHALARGMDPMLAMAELLGKQAGCSKGKGGSMHFFDIEKGFLGGHAIVASHIPLAAGVAFAIQYRKEDRVVLCYFGDGAIDQGALHEGFNMASLWKLPVVYILENNQMSMGTHLHRHSCILDMTVRLGAAYGIPAASIDGNDVELMYQTTKQAIERARAGEGPGFIEARTYRFRGHSMSDPAKYRTKEELDQAKERDPIVLYERLLRRAAGLTRRPSRSCTRRSRPRSRPPSSSPSTRPTPLEALYDDVTASPYVPQE